MSKKPLTTTENPDYYPDPENEWISINPDDIPLVCSPGHDCTAFSIEQLLDMETIEMLSKTAKTLDTIVAIFGLFLTVLHLFFLTRKELRANFVFMLMIGITASDFLIFVSYSLLFWNQWYLAHRFEPFKACTSFPYDYQIIDWIRIGVTNTFGLASVTMTLLMAAIRTVTVMFPMSTWIQKLMTGTSAVLTIILSVIMSFAWKSVYFLNARIVEEKAIYNLCPYPELTFELYTNLSRETRAVMNSIDTYISIVFTILYVIFTVLLLIELARARKRRANLRTEKKTNTTSIIMAMAVSYLVSELLLGVSIRIKSVAVDPRFIQGVEDLYNCLVTINTVLHTFFCFMMSSQYRETVFKTIRCGKMKSLESDKVFERVTSAKSVPSVNTVGTRESSK